MISTMRCAALLFHPISPRTTRHAFYLDHYCEEQYLIKPLAAL
jgi:hypothetical protein